LVGNCTLETSSFLGNQAGNQRLGNPRFQCIQPLRTSSKLSGACAAGQSAVPADCSSSKLSGACAAGLPIWISNLIGPFAHARTVRKTLGRGRGG
jgi:hypothetical protein